MIFEILFVGSSNHQRYPNTNTLDILRYRSQDTPILGYSGLQVSCVDVEIVGIITTLSVELFQIGYLIQTITAYYMMLFEELWWDFQDQKLLEILKYFSSSEAWMTQVYTF